MKNSKLFYEARDAIESQSYKQTKTRVLRKYLEELSIIQPWESDQNCFQAVLKKNEWIATINSEIQKRKNARLNFIREHSFSFVMGVLITVVGSLIVFFILRPFEQEKSQPVNIILSKEKEKMISTLLKDKECTITINCIKGDQAGCQFALEIKDIFNSAKWYVNGVNSNVYAGYDSGLILTAKKMPLQVETISQAFNSIGRNVNRVINLHMEDNQLELVVGTP